MRPIIVGALAATAAMTLSTVASANAEMLCKDRNEVIQQLSNAYSEAPVAMGLASNGSVLEVLSSEGGAGTWTILITQPDGTSCIMATGDSWQPVDEITISADPVY